MSNKATPSLIFYHNGVKMLTVFIPTVYNLECYYNILLIEILKKSHFLD